MKGTEHFKKTIAEYLNQRAATDPLFAPNLAKEGKNIEDCITYILNQVKASGCNGFSDDEIYSMAVHYYDEDDIKIGEKIECQVAVNHVVELSDEEKEEARQEAINEYKDEQLRKLREAQRKMSSKKTEEKQEEEAQTSLFGALL